jgi:small conductance mechanosensitive channel
LVVITAAASQVGINTASFLTILGTAGLAIGLALKDSLSNFAAGVMLVLFRPFRVGDYVTVGGVSGTAKEISIFNTLLTTPDNQQIIVPNGKVMGDVIINVTKHPNRRIDLVVGIGYEDDIKKAKEIMEKVVKEHENVLADPAPQVAVCELGDSSVNFVVRPWTETANYWPTRFALIENIKIALDGAGISIPFPQRDVHLYQEKAADA